MWSAWTGLRTRTRIFYSGGSCCNTNSLTLGIQGGPNATVDTDTGNFVPGVRNQGWWSATHINFTANDNYFVGDLSNNGTTLLNNFFTFDISGVTGTVTSAVFNVQRFGGVSTQGFFNHTYSIFDVSTAVATLNANDGTSAAIFNDLGSGISYGSHSITVLGLQAEILNLSLNGNALADLNTAIGNQDNYFSIGGTLFPVAVPEPATLLLLGAGLMSLGVFRRVTG